MSLSSQLEHLKGASCPLPLAAALLSVITCVLYHIPFLSYIPAHVQPGPNGVFIFISWLTLLLAVNFLGYTLVLFLGRKVGKFLTGVSLIINAVCLYFINTYDVMLDDTMMGNVFNTRYSEATSYVSWSGALYVLLLGALPCAALAFLRVRYGSWKRFATTVGCTLAGILTVALVNMPNWTWVDKNSTVMGSLLLPWSYIVNSVRYQLHERDARREEIPLPDATLTDRGKRVAVLIIGESARRDHFSLYGYGRDTNPLLSRTDNLTTYKAESAATYTTAGVKAILDSQESDKFYEILPNYLYRSGVDVVCRTSNWGESPLHIADIQKASELRKRYPDQCPYDEVLTRGIDSLALGAASGRLLIVLHTSTSHGPSYYAKYPERFEVFTPVCRSVEMGDCSHEELMNAYDNTILYTDFLIHEVIRQLRELDGWTSTVFYVSDHGESLGENNLYMHGVPRALAPREQYEIPFIVWVSDPRVKTRPRDLVTQYSVFHSLTRFLGVDSPVYRSDLDLLDESGFVNNSGGGAPSLTEK